MRRTIKGIFAFGILCGFASAATAEESQRTLSLDSPRWAMVPQQVEDVSGQAGDATDSVPSLEGRQDETLRDALEMLSEDDVNVPTSPRDLDLDQQSASDVGTGENESLFSGRKAQFRERRFVLPPIAALTTDTSEIGNGETPEGYRQGEDPLSVSLPESGVDRAANWYWSQRYWAAANTFSHPLYFEDRMLERHGQSRFPHLQPFVSAARFASQTALLPYLSAISPPDECQYSLGYYRAGSCVPAFLQRPPYQRKALVAEGAFVGAIIGLP
ncbi:hypothetical protein [Roseiconus lacunae]|uniref:Uncharacterized protein n=1 Tax=Roseiconus lacunae TaxID=2605694 RepID=A0ABT7PPF1_9BACT|nr:hypothetical protein [Roseiconus lacunae]MDM4018388.1 hypothetical protein [Roseiconus lacunae]WRQ49257.1 hypothetical protein U8335_20140 [Stieleria sp. HD01]